MPNPENVVGNGFEKHPERINRKGRPKMPDLKEVIAEILSSEKEGDNALKRIVKKLQQLAENGNIKAAELLMSRGYGLPRQSVEHSVQMTEKRILIQKDGEEINLLSPMGPGASELPPPTNDAQSAR